MVLPYQRHQKANQLQKQQQQQNQKEHLSWSNLRDKPFWIWDKEQHLQKALETNQQCCFQHIVKLPTKDGKEYPLFDYEKILYDTLMLQDNAFKDKHLYVLKSTGLGVSEFFLRLMAWLCVKDDSYRNSQMVIVTGPNIDIAIKLIKRLKAIFEPKLNIIFQDKENVLNLNGCSIEAYPSNHLDSFRALTNPKFILLDESDFWRKSEQEDVRHVTERYIGKSDPFIVMVSTPNCPGSLMENISKEPEETCIYKRLYLDWTFGLDSIYSRQEIEKAKKSLSFSREYDLHFAGLIGNTFHTKDIDRAVELGETYDPDLINMSTQKVLGIDPGWGSSAFGLVLLEYINGQIHVKLAEEYERPRYEDMTDKIMGILKSMNQWSLNQSTIEATKIYIDASNPEFISSLKRAIGERDDWPYITERLQRCKKNNLQIADYMTVCPIPFSTEGKNMLIHTKELLEYEKRPLIGINERFDKLIVALRTAVSDDSGKLDKESTSYDNVLDSFRLALKFFNIKTKETQKPTLLTS